MARVKSYIFPLTGITVLETVMHGLKRIFLELQRLGFLAAICSIVRSKVKVGLRLIFLQPMTD